MDNVTIEKGIRKKEPRVYEYLMDTYSRLLWTVASAILSGSGTREDIEEVVSQVFVSLWEKPELYDASRGSLKSFLCLRARSLAIDRLRSLLRNASVELEEGYDSGGEDMADKLIEGQTIEAITRCIKEMNPPDKQIMTLRFIYELKPSLIAGKLKLPIGTVYEKIRKGKEKIIAEFSQEVEE